MEWRIWITWWILFSIRYWRLYWIHLENHETVTGNPILKIYRITFKIKTWYYLELLMSETMKLLGSTKSKITKDENGENVPHLEITKVVWVHCNVVNNLRVLNTFVADKSFGQLLVISFKNFIFLNRFHSEFSYIEVWFTDQISKPLEIEDKINSTLVIN